MKVAIIVPSLKNVGPVLVVKNIIEYITRSSCIDVTVFYIKKSEGVTFSCNIKKLSAKNYFELYSYDVIHSHMLRPDFIVGFLPFYNGCKISTVHNIVTDDLYYSYGTVISRVFSRIWKLIWSRFDKIVVLSKVAEQFYSNFGIQSDKLEIIYNGVSDAKSKCEVSDSDLKEINDFTLGRKTLGTICLFNNRKGLDQIIFALQFLKDYCFIVIGDGPVKDELYDLATKLGVRKQLLILGFRENARDYLEKFDIYVLPSRSEGVPLALMEAISANKTVVCSDITIFKELFDDTEVSFFKLEDIDSLVASIKHAFYKKEHLAKNAKLKFNKNYKIEHMGKDYIALYQNVDSNRKLNT